MVRLIYAMVHRQPQWPEGTTYEEARAGALDEVERSYDQLVGYSGYGKMGTFEEYSARVTERFEKEWKFFTNPDDSLVFEKWAVDTSTLEETIAAVESLPKFVRWFGDPRKEIQSEILP
jgi:hypothetical protein